MKRRGSLTTPPAPGACLPHAYRIASGQLHNTAPVRLPARPLAHSRTCTQAAALKAFKEKQAKKK